MARRGQREGERRGGRTRGEGGHLKFESGFQLPRYLEISRRRPLPQPTDIFNHCQFRTHFPEPATPDLWNSPLPFTPGHRLGSLTPRLAHLPGSWTLKSSSELLKVGLSSAAGPQPRLFPPTLSPGMQVIRAGPCIRATRRGPPNCTLAPRHPRPRE